MLPILKSSIYLTRVFSSVAFILAIFSLLGGLPKGPFANTAWASNDNILLSLWGSCPRSHNTSTEVYYSDAHLSSESIPCITIFNGPRYDNPLSMGSFNFGRSLSVFSLQILAFPLIPVGILLAYKRMFVSAFLASGSAFAFQIFGVSFALYHFQTIVNSKSTAVSLGAFELGIGVYIGGVVALLSLFSAVLYLVAFFHDSSNIIFYEPSNSNFWSKFSLKSVKSKSDSLSTIIEIKTSNS